MLKLSSEAARMLTAADASSAGDVFYQITALGFSARVEDRTFEDIKDFGVKYRRGAARLLKSGMVSKLAKGHLRITPEGRRHASGTTTP